MYCVGGQPARDGQHWHVLQGKSQRQLGTGRTGAVGIVPKKYLLAATPLSSCKTYGMKVTEGFHESLNRKMRTA